MTTMRVTLAACLVALLPAGALAQPQPGSILSWGYNGIGQVSNTPTGTGFTQVASGDAHSLALRSDGSIAAWGDDLYSQVSNTPTGTGFAQVAGGWAHSLAIITPPTASFTPFGISCAGTAGVPVLAAQGSSLPRLGTTFSTTVSPLGSTSTPFGILSTTKLGFPYPLSWIGMQGCSLYMRIDVSMQLPVTGVSATWDLPIPNMINLLGQSPLYQQAFVLDPLGSATSNAGTMIIGY